MAELGENLLTVKDLAARWQKKPKQVRKILKNHLAALEPTKIGRTILVKPENIIKYEKEMRLRNE